MAWAWLHAHADRIERAVTRTLLTPGLHQVAKITFALLVAASVGWLLAGEGAAILAAIGQAAPHMVALGLVGAITHLMFAALSWRCLVPPHVGSLDTSTSARIFFLSQLGKYLPGGVWNFVAAAEIGRAAGIARGPIVASFALALMIGVASSLVVALTLVPQFLAVSEISPWLIAAAASLASAAYFARSWLHRVWVGRFATLTLPDPQSLMKSALLAIGGWFAAGFMTSALLVALGTEPDLSLLLTATGAYAFAWLAGFVVFVAPAGLAVREAALIAVLTTQVDMSAASAAAILARAVVTLADLLAGLAAAAIAPASAPNLPAVALDEV